MVQPEWNRTRNGVFITKFWFNLLPLRYIVAIRLYVFGHERPSKKSYSVFSLHMMLSIKNDWLFLGKVFIQTLKTQHVAFNKPFGNNLKYRWEREFNSRKLNKKPILCRFRTDLNNTELLRSIILLILNKNRQILRNCFYNIILVLRRAYLLWTFKLNFTRSISSSWAHACRTSWWYCLTFNNKFIPDKPFQALQHYPLV